MAIRRGQACAIPIGVPDGVRRYPDADGPVHGALDDTAYGPDAYPRHRRKVWGRME